MDLSAVVVIAETRSVLSVLAPELAPAPLDEAAESRLRALRLPGDRDDFLAARLLAARVLGEAGAGPVMPAELRQRCDVCGGAHGRPLPVAGLQVSWSHSRGWVTAGASRGRIGVDVEAATEVVGADAGLFDQALTVAERALVRSSADPWHSFRLAWTAKEACVKAGEAHLDGFRGFGVLAGPDSLLPSVGGLLLSTHRSGAATASAATAGPTRWSVLGDRGELIAAS